jgi:NTP pyrophosphatase (non-canonical NTP hydrolase)
MATEDVLQEVLAEMARQDAKWGDQRQLPSLKWIAILGEEYGEVCKAVLEEDRVGYRMELVQVAAVAIQAIMSYDSLRSVNAWAK